MVSCINRTTPKTASGFPASNSSLQQSILYPDLSKANSDHWCPMLFMSKSDPTAGIQSLCHSESPPILAHPVPVPACLPDRTWKLKRTCYLILPRLLQAFPQPYACLLCFFSQHSRNTSISTYPLHSKAWLSCLGSSKRLLYPYSSAQHLAQRDSQYLFLVNE